MNRDKQNYSTTIQTAYEISKQRRQMQTNKNKKTTGILLLNRQQKNPIACRLITDSIKTINKPNKYNTAIKPIITTNENKHKQN